MTAPQFPIKAPYGGWDSQGYTSGHKAIDIGWLTKHTKGGGKDPVMASLAGKVIQAGKISETIGGKKYHPIVVVLQCDDGGNRYFLRYWHLSAVKVKTGQTVKQGEIVGIRGNSGKASGVHLHFEMLKCPKGTDYFKSCTGKNWTKYNINPAPLLRLYDGQVFQATGRYQIAKLSTSNKQEAPKPVERDSRKNQIEVIADALRIRVKPSLQATIRSLCNKGIFTIYDTEKADGYTWYKIADDSWIASKEGEWTRLLAGINQEDELVAIRVQLDAIRVQLDGLENEVDTILSRPKGMDV